MGYNPKGPREWYWTEWLARNQHSNKRQDKRVTGKLNVNYF